MDLIGQLSQQLGVAPDKAQGAAGAVFQLLQSQTGGGGGFDKLLGAAPEVKGWMAQAQALTGGGAAGAAGGGGGGLGGALGGLLGGGGGDGGGGLGGMLGGSGGSGGLGGMLGAAAGALGGAGGAAGQAGQLALLSGLLGKLGLSPGVATIVGPLVVQFIQAKLGAGGLQQLASAAPLLQGFLGGGSGGGGAPGGGGGGLGGLLGGFGK